MCILHIQCYFKRVFKLKIISTVVEWLWIIPNKREGQSSFLVLMRIHTKAEIIARTLLWSVSRFDTISQNGKTETRRYLPAR
mmetsp:Transcript_15074/g.17074  ORF Transcript_15074/g.17074 Transcript_15074/m.17074 type:complete len:82 (+) Transcript_15074:588-833(+)